MNGSDTDQPVPYRSANPGRVRPLVIVGPTAAGKSALAVGLADKLRDQGTSVELINADSMQVYRGMDIGTAKASASERQRIPHHLLDVVEPSEEFSVAEFVRLANDALDDIHTRGSLAIVVGGTGLYVQALVDGMQIPGQFPEERESLEANSDTGALYNELMDLDPDAAARIDPNNRRRIVRALEVTLGSGRPFSSYGDGFDSYPETDYVMVGIEIDRGDLGIRIRQRLDRLLEEGFVEEVRRLQSGPVLSKTASRALGYSELQDYLTGETDLATAVETTALRTRQFSVRQIKWFRRDPRIKWFDYDWGPDEIIEAVQQHWLGQR